VYSLHLWSDRLNSGFSNHEVQHSEQRVVDMLQLIKKDKVYALKVYPPLCPGVMNESCKHFHP
jgi:hypothetical protein